MNMKRILCVLLTVAMLIPCISLMTLLPSSRFGPFILDEGTYLWPGVFGAEYPKQGDSFYSGRLQFVNDDVSYIILPYQLNWYKYEDYRWKEIDIDEEVFEFGNKYRMIQKFGNQSEISSVSGDFCEVAYSSDFSKCIADYFLDIAAYFSCYVGVNCDILLEGKRFVMQVTYDLTGGPAVTESTFMCGKKFRLDEGDNPLDLFYTSSFLMDGEIPYNDGAINQVDFAIARETEDGFDTIHEEDDYMCVTGETLRLEMIMYQNTAYTAKEFGEETIKSLKRCPFFKDAGYGKEGQYLEAWFQFKVGEIPTFVRGDVDGNGSVEAKDYIKLKRYVLHTYGTDDPYEMDRLNVDQKGGVDSKDYIMLKRVVLNSYSFPEREVPYVYDFD